MIEGGKWKKYGILIISILGIALFIVGTSPQETSPVQKSETAGFNTPPIPSEVTFCDEHVPVNHFDVRESLERELIVNTYYHSQTILNIKKANRYFPVIEPILKENNIPDDFKYLVVAESSLSHVVSPKGATGFWQILEATGKEYGLEINSQVDERYHLEKATKVACDYLNDSYKKFQNWTLVAASYNMGRKGIDRQMTRQHEKDYYDLLLNSETARYVFRVLAIKLILEKPEDYGFQIHGNELYQPITFTEKKITAEIPDIAAFAQENGTNYKLLKILNPWLRDNKLTNSQKKEYTLKIPRKNSREVK